MAKYTEKQTANAEAILYNGVDNVQNFIDYLRSEECKRDMVDGLWAEPDPLEEIKREVREAIAVEAERIGLSLAAKNYRNGENDNLLSFRVTVRILAKERGVRLPDDF